MSLLFADDEMLLGDVPTTPPDVWSTSTIRWTFPKAFVDNYTSANYDFRNTKMPIAYYYFHNKVYLTIPKCPSKYDFHN